MLELFHLVHNMESRNSTPSMEEEDLQFQQIPPREYPISPVVVVTDRPSFIPAPPVAVRLPSPYPVFNASWPLPTMPQGPRAFIRSSLVFQPATRQFRPIAEVTTSPELSDGHVTDASNEDSLTASQDIVLSVQPQQ